MRKQTTGSETPKVRADEIAHALSKLNGDGFFLTEVKTGPTQYADKGDLQKLDAMAFKKSWANPCFSGYEIKVSRSDFLQDDKWPNYLNYCHRFYFACPAGLIQPQEVAPEVGLVWYNPFSKTANVRKAALYRKIETPYDMLYYIIMSRLKNEKHPFFSSHRELIEAFLQDRIDRKQLSHHFRSKLVQGAYASEERAKSLEAELEGARKRLGEYEQVQQLLRTTGINTWYFQRTLEELRVQLQTGVGPKVLDHVIQARAELDRVVKMLVPTGKEVEN